MSLLTYCILCTLIAGISCDVAKDSSDNIVKRSTATRQENRYDSESPEAMLQLDLSFNGGSNNVPAVKEETSRLSGLYTMTEELTKISSTIVDLLNENNRMIKTFLQNPETDSDDMIEMIDLVDPGLTGHNPYILDPLIFLKDATEFPEALSVHLEGQFVIAENVGLRIGWAQGQPNFHSDYLALNLHFRWNGDHTPYGFHDSWNRKISADYRNGASWGGLPESDVTWPFQENVKFYLDIYYKDGCFNSTIRSAGNEVYIPMCHPPEAQGDLYLSLHTNKPDVVPLQLSTVTLSLKEATEAE